MNYINKKYKKKYTPKNNKKRFIIILSVSLLIVGITTISIFALKKDDLTKNPVFTVDNIEVFYEEFNLHLQNKKALTANYFKEEYDVDFNDKFWTSTYHGENPTEYVKKQALDDLLEIKVEQMLMKENNIIQDISYHTFLENLQEENQKRKSDFENEKTIYGSTQYDTLEYYNYEHHINWQRLVGGKSKEFENELSDHTFNEFYWEIREDYFKQPDSFYYQVISINNEQKTSITLEDIKREILEGQATFEDIHQNHDISINVEVKTLDPEMISRDSIFERNLYDVFLELKEGDFTDTYLVDNEEVIFRLKNRNVGEYNKYKDVKKEVAKIYTQKQLEEEVSQRLRNIKVVFNDEVYDKITMY